jgi:hypothetical protein
MWLPDLIPLAVRWTWLDFVFGLLPVLWGWWLLVSGNRTSSRRD